MQSLSKKTILLFAVLGMFSTGACGGAAAPVTAPTPVSEETVPSMTAQQVLDRHVEVTGGRSAYEKRTAVVMKSTVSLPKMGITGTQTLQAQADRFRSVMDLVGMGQQITGFDGTLVWSQSAMEGTRVLTGKERAQLLIESVFNREIHLAELYDEITLEGREAFHGIEAYKLHCTSKEAGTETAFFSVETGELIGIKKMRYTPMGEAQEEVFLSEYREVGGIRYPFTFQGVVADMEILAKVDSIETPASIAADVFTAPAELTAK